MVLNTETTHQVAELIRQGHSVAEIAAGWGITACAIYKALKREHLMPAAARTTPAEHLDLQRASECPPEVYAHRAGMSFATLRRHAWAEKVKLACNTHAERKAWWIRRFTEFSPANAKAFCALNDLPVPMVAHWYHKLAPHPVTLLWGFNQLLVLPEDKVPIPARLKDKTGTLFAVGRGKTAVPISIRTANELFSFAHSYQH